MNSLPLDIWELVSLNLSHKDAANLMLAVCARTKFFKNNTYIINRLLKYYYKSYNYDASKFEELNLRIDWLALLKIIVSTQQSLVADLMLTWHHADEAEITKTIGRRSGICSIGWQPLDQDVLCATRPLITAMRMVSMSRVRLITFNANLTKLIASADLLYFNSLYCVKEGLCQHKDGYFSLIMNDIDFEALIDAARFKAFQLYAAKCDYINENIASKLWLVKLIADQPLTELPVDIDLELIGILDVYQYESVCNIEFNTDDKTIEVVVRSTDFDGVNLNYPSYEDYHEYNAGGLFKFDYSFYRSTQTTPTALPPTIKCLDIQFKVVVTEYQE